jgi:hypothetical protein
MRYPPFNPDYLKKLDDGQREYILTGSGWFFAYEFLFVPAEHGYVIGPTGSGKTNKMVNLCAWLKHTEVILWISASKDQDIVPLFFMGKPVNIIIPEHSGIEILLDGNPFPNVTYSWVSDPQDIFYAIKNDHINILEVRNAFWDRAKLLDFMIEFFKLIAEWTRNGNMPRFRPDKKSSGKSKISVFIDESQWLIAGSKVTNDPHRTKATAVISENALEIRTYGWRLIIASQGFTNIPPIIRENMACTFLCSGADIKDPPKLRLQCFPNIPGYVSASRFKKSQYKFLNRNGDAIPVKGPVQVPLYPKNPEDRELAERVRIKYAKTFHDQHNDAEDIQFAPSFPSLDKLYNAVIPEKIETNGANCDRYYLPEGWDQID